MTDTQTNRTINKLRLLCIRGIASLHAESCWVDYVLALDTLLDNNNTATRLITYTMILFLFFQRRQ